MPEAIATIVLFWRGFNERAPSSRRRRIGANAGTVPAARPKGRQVDPRAVEEVRALLTDRSRRRDLLIEHLHLIQDHYGHISARISPRSPPR